MFVLQEKFNNFLVTFFSPPSDRERSPCVPRATVCRRATPPKGSGVLVPTDVAQAALQMFRKSDTCKD